MSRASVRGAVVLVLLALVVPSRVGAQLTSPWPNLPIEFVPSVTLSERYNDNYFQQTHDKTSEFRTTIAPAFDVTLTTGKTRSDLHYTLNAFHSTALGNNPHFQHLLALNSRYALTERFSLLLNEALTQSDDPGIANPQGVDNQVTLRRNDISLSLLYEGDRHSGFLRYTNSNITRDFAAGSTSTSRGRDGDETSSSFKNTLNAFAGGGKLLVGSRTTLEGSETVTLGDFTTTGASGSNSSFVVYETNVGLTREFPGETRGGLTSVWTLRDPDEGDSLHLVRTAITAVRPITPTLAASASVGYDFARGAVRVDEPAGSLSLTYLGDPFTATLSLAQALHETFASSQNVGLTRTREFALGGTYKPTNRLTLSARGSIVHTKFFQPEVAAQQGIVLPGTAAQPASTFYSLETSATVLISRIFSLSLSYVHWIRDLDDRNSSSSTTSSTSFALRDFKSNAVTLSLRARYE